MNAELGAMVRFAGEEQQDRPKTANQMALPPRPMTAKEEREALVMRLQVRMINTALPHFQFFPADFDGARRRL